MTTNWQAKLHLGCQWTFGVAPWQLLLSLSSQCQGRHMSVSPIMALTTDQHQKWSGAVCCQHQQQQQIHSSQTFDIYTRSNFVIPFQMRTRTLWLLTMIWGSTLTGEWVIPWSHQLYSPSFLSVTWDMRKPLPVPNMLLGSRVQYWLLADTMSSANPLPVFLFLPAQARQPRL